MIQLTQFNRRTVMINALHIEKVESTPDTVITLVTGRKLIVRESIQVVQQKAIEFYQHISIFGLWKDGLPPNMIEGGGEGDG